MKQEIRSPSPSFSSESSESEWEEKYRVQEPPRKKIRKETYDLLRDLRYLLENFNRDQELGRKQKPRGLKRSNNFKGDELSEETPLKKNQTRKRGRNHQATKEDVSLWIQLCPFWAKWKGAYDGRKKSIARDCKYLRANPEHLGRMEKKSVAGIC